MTSIIYLRKYLIKLCVRTLFMVWSICGQRLEEMQQETGTRKKPLVGWRIRELREQRKLSLRALAEQSGLSINAISRIERDECSPTVSSLHRLATALGVPITSFFEDGTMQATILVRRDRRLKSHSDAVVIESLGTGLPDQQIEPFLMTLEPGAGEVSEPITHPGEEFVHCLEGEIEYQVGDEWHQLRAGDSLLFQATQPHIWRNTSNTSAKILLVMQTISDGYISRRQHLNV